MVVEAIPKLSASVFAPRAQIWSGLDVHNHNMIVCLLMKEGELYLCSSLSILVPDLSCDVDAVKKNKSLMLVQPTLTKSDPLKQQEHKRRHLKHAAFPFMLLAYQRGPARFMPIG